MKIALAQIQAYEDPLAYDERALQEQWKQRLQWAIEQATTAQADLVVLPELATIPYLVESYPDIVRVKAICKENSVIHEARDAAANHGLAIAIPFPEKADGVYYNSVRVFDSNGAHLVHYRKLHVPCRARAPEKALFSEGTTHSSIFELNGIQIGVAICYDRHFPEVFRSLALHGAEAVIVPNAAAGSLKAVWKAEGIAHAVFNRMYYLAVNRVGVEVDPNRPFFGQSFAVSPWGEVIACSQKSAQDCLVVDLSRNETQDARKAWPFLSECQKVWRLSKSLE